MDEATLSRLINYLLGQNQREVNHKKELAEYDRSVKAMWDQQMNAVKRLEDNTAAKDKVIDSLINQIEKLKEQQKG